MSDLRITQIGRPICIWLANRTSDLQIGRLICVFTKCYIFDYTNMSIHALTAPQPLIGRLDVILHMRKPDSDFYYCNLA